MTDASQSARATQAPLDAVAARGGRPRRPEPRRSR